MKVRQTDSGAGTFKDDGVDLADLRNFFSFRAARVKTSSA